MSQPKQLLLMGLPAAGKTTYLAALWHQVSSKEVSSSLRLEKVDGDRTFLNQIRDQWMSAVAPKRTDLDIVQPVLLQLVPTAGGDAFALEIPDLAGEIYRSQWQHRQMVEHHQERIRAVDGVLLLIHSRVFKSVLLSEMQPAFPAKSTLKSARPDKKSARDWNPEETPTQVMLVDLLQMMAAERAGCPRLRVAILITAWDLIADPKPSPGDWLRNHLPLLDQYVSSNPQWFTVQSYGVSAQGGDYENSDQREELTSHLRHTKRIQMAGPDCQAHDLTAPIFWLLS